MKKLPKSVLLTGVVVVAALLSIVLKYWDYIANPWTRDGQVRANVIQVTPRVSGPIVRLPIRDNQFVRAGELLYEIDPRTFEASRDEAQAKLDQTLDELAALDKQVSAAKAVVSQSLSGIAESESALRGAEARLADAEVKFKRYRKLVSEGTIPRQQFDDVRADYEIALSNKEQADAALLEATSALLQTEADLAQAEATLGARGEENARLRGAKAALEVAELNLEFTKVRASVDGYVTNLNLRLGSQAVANQPAMALVDVNSYWVDAYFRESLVGRFRAGDRAVVTLMSYPDIALYGSVDSIGWGIAQSDGSEGSNLLPQVSPTFEWIRLAQRIPVRIHLDPVPEGVDLRVGTTASVLVMTGTSDRGADEDVTPAPRLLQ